MQLPGKDYLKIDVDRISTRWLIGLSRSAQRDLLHRPCLCSGYATRSNLERADFDGLARDAPDGLRDRSDVTAFSKKAAPNCS